MSEHERALPQFYITPPQRCPYLDGRLERKVFTHLVGDQAAWLNNTLTHGGFRRSQNIAYRPACEKCSACVSVRVRVDEFAPSRSQRRVARCNRDLGGRMCETVPRPEHYSLFRDYIDHRHSGGGMADMTVLDFASMVEDSYVNTRIVEYRTGGSLPAPDSGPSGDLLAVALTDILDDGLSMIYSFFDVEQERRSLGTFMILDHIELARKLGLPYVYLGYWVKRSQKMDYKVRFRPQDHLGEDGWRLADPAVPHRAGT